MFTKVKKTILSFMTMLTFLAVFFGFLGPTLSVSANSTLSFTFNHSLTDGTLMTDQNILDTINNNSFINGAPIDLASSVSSLSVKAIVSGTSKFIRLDQTANGTSEMIISFNLNYQYFKQITFSADRITGNGSMEIYVNNSSTLSNSFADSGNDFLNYTVSSTSTIQVLRFKPQSGQNQWNVAGITFTSIDLSQLATKVETYTLSGCETTATITKQLTDAEVQQLNDLYSSMSTTEKDTFKTNYPNAWGRMKWLFDKKNLTY